MRIDEIEVVNLRFEYPPGGGFRYAGGTATGRLTTLVRVHARGGLTGIGTAYTNPELARVVIEEQLAPRLRGTEITDVAETWRDMMRLVRWYGRGGAAVTALGAIDTALWDLRAQEAGQPLWQYLAAMGGGGVPGSPAGGAAPGGPADGAAAGGSAAEAAAADVVADGTVAAYASGLLWQDDLGLLRREAISHLDAGFTRVKMRLGRCRDYDVAAFLAVRDAVAGRGEVIVDGSLRFSDADASWLAAFLGRHGAVWFEEPFEPDNLGSYAGLRDRGLVPLAAGENETGPRGFAELIRRRAVDVVQPDVSRAGGVTSVLRVAAMARDAGLPIATHSWSDAVAVLANAHVVASVPNGMTVEIDRTGNPFVDDLLAEPLMVTGGRLRLPSAPGLGIRLDESVLGKYRLVAGKVPDGNYSDMAFGPVVTEPVPAYSAGWHESA
jgi:L-alanine-DL-glutamate epimerase-like enolase superfamily enzyme